MAGGNQGAEPSIPLGLEVLVDRLEQFLGRQAEDDLVGPKHPANCAALVQKKRCRRRNVLAAGAGMAVQGMNRFGQLLLRVAEYDEMRKTLLRLGRIVAV